jgi:hypothetical protein
VRTALEVLGPQRKSMIYEIHAMIQGMVFADSQKASSAGLF